MKVLLPRVCDEPLRYMILIRDNENEEGNMKEERNECKLSFLFKRILKLTVYTIT